MPINLPTTETDPTCPVSSTSFYTENGIPIDDSHCHDNRYYTQIEIDDKLEDLSVNLELKGELTGSIGVKSFVFNGTENASVELNFVSFEFGNFVGSSEQPARFDHFHKNLIAGSGLLSNMYNGSTEKTFSVDFGYSGISNKVSRDDHLHPALTDGYGIKSLNYTGNQAAIVEIDYGPVDEWSGTLPYPSRKDHIHRTLLSGDGIAGFSYNGSVSKTIEVNFSNNGTSTKVSRDDHVHTDLGTKQDLLSLFASTKQIDNKLEFYNTENTKIHEVIIEYSTTTGKFQIPRNIALAGVVQGTCFNFDGSNDALINAVLDPTDALFISSVNSLINNVLIGTGGDTSFADSVNNVINLTSNDWVTTSGKEITEILKATKLASPRTFRFIGGATGQAIFDGTNDLDIELSITLSQDLANFVLTSLIGPLTNNNSGILYDSDSVSFKLEDRLIQIINGTLDILTINDLTSPLGKFTDINVANNIEIENTITVVDGNRFQTNILLGTEDLAKFLFTDEEVLDTFVYTDSGFSYNAIDEKIYLSRNINTSGPLKINNSNTASLETDITLNIDLAGTATVTSNGTPGTVIYAALNNTSATNMAATPAGVTNAISALSSLYRTEVQVNTQIDTKLSGITFTTTAPLTGGGNLASNRTLAINAASAATESTNGNAGSVIYAASNNTDALNMAATPAGVKNQIDSRITYGTTDLTPGVSPLKNGVIYFVYE